MSGDQTTKGMKLGSISAYALRGGQAHYVTSKPKPKMAPPHQKDSSMSDGHYNLVLSFPDQSDSFAHGFTCGRIWQAMIEYPARDVVETVLAETRPTIEAMAMAKGWTEEIEDLGSGWLSVRLRSPLSGESSPSDSQ